VEFWYSTVTIQTIRGPWSHVDSTVLYFYCGSGGCVHVFLPLYHCPYDHWPGLEVEWYGLICDTGTFLAAWKLYQHLFFEKSYWYALQAILWDLGNWSLTFASISGQNSASLSGGRKGRHSNHTGTYFYPLRVRSMTVVSRWTSMLVLVNKQLLRTEDAMPSLFACTNCILHIKKISGSFFGCHFWASTTENAIVWKVKFVCG